MTPRVLVVDDHPPTLSIVSLALQTRGFECAAEPNTVRAWDRLGRESFDLLILDVMTPRGSDIDLVKRIRAGADDVPIILLTALGDEEDRIHGLEAGADDYMTKPFSPRELVLRAQAILRRTAPARVKHEVEAGELRIDLDRRSASWRGAPLALSPTELKVLAALAGRAGRDVSREDLLDEAWETGDAAGAHDMIKTTIYRLRRRLEKAGVDPGIIAPVRGRGYRLSIDEEATDSPAEPDR